MAHNDTQNYAVGSKRPMESPQDELPPLKKEKTDLDAVLEGFFNLMFTLNLKGLSKVEVEWLELNDLKEKNRSLGWRAKRRMDNNNGEIRKINQWIEEENLEQEKSIPALPEFSLDFSAHPKHDGIYVSLVVTILSLECMLQENGHALREFYKLYIKAADCITQLQNVALKDISSLNTVIHAFNKGWAQYEKAQRKNPSGLWYALGALPTLDSNSLQGFTQVIEKSPYIAFAQLNIAASAFKETREKHLRSYPEWKLNRMSDSDREAVLNNNRMNRKNQYEEIKSLFNKLKEILVNASERNDALLVVADRLIKDLNTVLRSDKKDTRSSVRSDLEPFDLLSYKLLQVDYLRLLNNNYPVDFQGFESSESIEQDIGTLYDHWSVTESKTAQKFQEVVFEAWRLLYVWHCSSSGFSEEVDWVFKEFNQCSRKYHEQDSSFPLYLFPRLELPNQTQLILKRIQELKNVWSKFRKCYERHESPYLETESDLVKWSQKPTEQGKEKRTNWPEILQNADKHRAIDLFESTDYPFLSYPIERENVILKESYLQLIFTLLQGTQRINTKHAVFNQKQGYLFKDFCESFYRILKGYYGYLKLGETLSNTYKAFFADSKKILDSLMYKFIIACQEIITEEKQQDHTEEAKQNNEFELLTLLEPVISKLSKGLGEPDLFKKAFPEAVFAEMYCLTKVLQIQSSKPRKEKIDPSHLYIQIVDCYDRLKDLLDSQAMQSANLVEQIDRLIDELNTILDRYQLCNENIKPLQRFAELHNQEFLRPSFR